MITQLDMFATPEPATPQPMRTPPHTPRCACGADLKADRDWFIWGEFGDWQCRACWEDHRRTYVSRRPGKGSIE